MARLPCSTHAPLPHALPAGRASLCRRTRGGVCPSGAAGGTGSRPSSRRADMSGTRPRHVRDTSHRLASSTSKTMSGTRPRHVRDMSHRLAAPEEESAALEREEGAYCVMTSGTTSAAKTALIEAEDVFISRADRSGRRVHVSQPVPVAQLQRHVPRGTPTRCTHVVLSTRCPAIPSSRPEAGVFSTQDRAAPCRRDDLRDAVLSRVAPPGRPRGHVLGAPMPPLLTAGRGAVESVWISC